MTLVIVTISFSIIRYPPSQPSEGHSKGNQTSQDSNLPKTFWEKVSDDPTAFFTMVLALLTFVLAGTSSVQILLLISADRTTRLAARAAVRSANVATRTVRSIELTAERQLRAYIGVERAFMTNPDPLNAPLAASLVIKNAGQTPAYRVRCLIVFGIYNTDFPSSVDNPINAEEASATTIMPNGTTESRYQNPSTNDFAKWLKIHGKLGFIFSGLISYVDVYGIERTTNVRMMSPTADSVFLFAPDGNGAT